MSLSDSLSDLQTTRDSQRGQASRRSRVGYGKYLGYDPSSGYQVDIDGTPKYFNRVANLGSIPVNSNIRIFGDTLVNNQVT